MHEILPLSAGDAAAAAYLERAAFSTPWSEADIIRDIEENHCAVWLKAQREGVMAGYVCARVAADEGEIITLCVAPEHRGRGVGRALLGRAQDICAQRGAKTLYLEVRTRNAPAIALYEGAGFTRCGVRKGYYTRPDDDAIIYRKEL